MPSFGSKAFDTDHLLGIMQKLAHPETIYFFKICSTNLSNTAYILIIKSSDIKTIHIQNREETLISVVNWLD